MTAWEYWGLWYALAVTLLAALAFFPGKRR